MKRFWQILTPLVVLSLVVFVMPKTANATTTIFTTSGTWTAPVGVTSVQVNAYAGGGGGGGCNSATTGGGNGGGGGAFSALTSFAVTAGNVYTVSVGQAGIGGVGSASSTIGGDSMFSASSTLLAKGGSPGFWCNAAQTATGGAAASGNGNTKFSGGNGGQLVGFSGGGGGGGGAGTANNGTAGNNGNVSSGAGGAGGTVGGGNGGNRSAGSGGLPGSTFGGAGGGSGGTASSPDNAGGSGARGEVDITYTIVNHAQVTLLAGIITQPKGITIIN